MQEGQKTSASSSPIFGRKRTARERQINGIIRPHLLSFLVGFLEQSLLQRLCRTDPPHTQRTCLFQPHTLRHQETHSRTRHQEFRKAACVTVFAAMDHACYAVAFVERGGVGVHDRAGKVAANHFRGRE